MCARGTALLSRVSGEIFDQVITTPEPFVVLLEVLYRRGGIAHTKAETVQSGDKVSKTCRLGIAKLMKAIFSEANESGVSRWVTCGMTDIGLNNNYSRSSFSGLAFQYYEPRKITDSN